MVYDDLDTGIHDLDDVAGLIYGTDPELFSRLFGRDQVEAKRKLRNVVVKGHSTFGYPNIQVAAEGRSVRGIIISYRTDEFDRNAEARDFLSLFNFAGLIRLMFWDMMIIAKIMTGRSRPDDLYISNISVAEDQRGKGIGTALLDLAQTRARMKKCGRMTLHVSITNPRARQLYERYGFRIISRQVLWYAPSIGTYKMEYPFE